MRTSFSCLASLVVECLSHFPARMMSEAVVVRHLRFASPCQWRGLYTGGRERSETEEVMGGALLFTTLLI